MKRSKRAMPKFKKGDKVYVNVNTWFKRGVNGVQTLPAKITTISDFADGASLIHVKLGDGFLPLNPSRVFKTKEEAEANV